MGCKKSKEPQTFCQRFANELSVVMGIAVSAACIAPMVLLTDTPCTTTTTLTRGEQLLCVAPSWTDTGNVAFTPSSGASGYIFDTEPTTNTSAPLVEDTRSGVDATITSHSYASYSAWLLAGSRVNVSVNASEPLDFYYFDAEAFDAFKYNKPFTALCEAKGNTSFAFEYQFAPNTTAGEAQLQRLTLVVQQNGNNAATINYTLAYAFTSLDLSGARASCHDVEECSFVDVKPGQVMLVVAHSNFTPGEASKLTMGWAYRTSIRVPGVLGTLCVFVVVVVAEALLVGLHRRKESKQRHHQHSDTPAIPLTQQSTNKTPLLTSKPPSSSPAQEPTQSGAEAVATL